MILRALTAAVTALCLSACTAPQQLGADYRDVPRTNFTHANNTYRIFDKPSAGKLVITRSVGGAMSDTMLRGVTFGAYNNAVPQTEVGAAVAAYLSSSGRTCTTSEGTKLAAPKWEFTYSCEIKFTAAP
jgi:hypothetical protein